MFIEFHCFSMFFHGFSLILMGFSMVLHGFRLGFACILKASPSFSLPPRRDDAPLRLNLITFYFQLADHPQQPDSATEPPTAQISRLLPVVES